MRYSSEQISNIIGGKLKGNPQNIVEHFYFDSRFIIYFSNSAFFAFKGRFSDGHIFIPQLLNAGIKVFIVEKDDYTIENDESYIIVDDTRSAFQKLATYHRRKFNIPVIGITGSYGKTIIKDWLYDILSEKFNITKSPKSYNSQIGVPFSVLLINENTQLAILEAGISEKNEMSKLQEIIQPTIGLFTNIGDAHNTGFSSTEEKIKEKIQLFKSAEIIFVPSKYKIVFEQLKNVYPEKRIIKWGYEMDSDLVISDIVYQKNKTELSVVYDNCNYEFYLPFVAEPYIENAITVILVSLFFKIEAKIIQDKLSNLSPSPMRLEVLSSINNNLIINDTYTSDVNTINYALNFMEKIKKSDKKVVIFSDFQCPEKEEQKSYSLVIDWLNHSNLQFFIGIGKKFQRYADMFQVKTFFYENVEDLIKNFNINDLSDTTILIKGSRQHQLDKIISVIELKHNRTSLKIDYNAIIHNLNYYRSLLPPNTKIMVMVKALSYGGGAFEIAKILQSNKVDYLGVAYIDEGIELRNNGIHIPIMVMNPSDDSYNLLFEYNLEPVIYSFKSFYEIINAAKYYSIDTTNVHIEIDTGMHRLGFLPSECQTLIKELKKQKYIKVKSVFSHLASAEDKNYDDFTLQQIELFLDVVNLFKNELNYNFLCHILNTAGIERFREYCLDMVRLGIGLYGFGTENSKPHLQNVFTFKTNISQIKWLKPPETVGYGRKGKINKDTKIAIIPVGYADGLNRNLGNGNYNVKIKEKKCPIIGNICMDMCMIDITDVDALEGDEVIIFDTIEDIMEIAQKLNTIPYEVLTSVSYRVKRIYHYE